MRTIEVWQAAELMMNVYGDDADLHAAMRADCAWDRGDATGMRLWNMVKHAIVQLTEGNTGGKLH